MLAGLENTHGAADRECTAAGAMLALEPPAADDALSKLGSGFAGVRGLEEANDESAPVAAPAAPAFGFLPLDFAARGAGGGAVAAPTPSPKSCPILAKSYIVDVLFLLVLLNRHVVAVATGMSVLVILPPPFASSSSSILMLLLLLSRRLSRCLCRTLGR